MAKRRKSVRFTAGDIFQISLCDGSFAYGQILEPEVFVFFDFNPKQPQELADIPNEIEAFCIWVTDYAVKFGQWSVLGNAPIANKFQRGFNFFKQDIISGELSVQTSLPNGIFKERPSTPSECMNLERAAVWDPEHVEDRLIDYFNNRPNKWQESLKFKAKP